MGKNLNLAFSFFIVFHSIVPVCLQAQSSELFKSWNQPIEPFGIIGNIYYVGANEIASYLIATSNGHILLDGGFPETAPMIAESIKQLGFRLQEVKILLNSHAHFDHAGGLAELKKLTGAKLIIMAGDVEAIENGGRELGKDFMFPPAKVDHILRDQENVILGEVILTAHLTPGHTKGNTTWTMQVEENGETYHVVFVGSPNVLPDVPLVNNLNYPEIAEDYKRTFAVLKSLSCDVFLSAHGSFFFLERKAKQLAEGALPNPFIDPQHYKNFVQRKENFFLERLQEDQYASKK